MPEKGEKARAFGFMEAGFDLAYLVFGLGLGLYILIEGKTDAARRAGAMALVLAGGDSFHLVPRVASVVAGGEARFRRALGIGKLITSVTMTAFYALLWQLGLLLSPGVSAAWTEILYALAVIRVALCLPAENRWTAEKPPVKWGVIRNIPFLLMGIEVLALFAVRGIIPFLPIAVALSFAFYIPVVLFSDEHPAIGALMLPKTLMYVWILVLCAQSVL